MTDLHKYLAPNLLEGSVAFITGGGSGINLGIAETFVQLGAKVAIFGRTPERLTDATAHLRELGGEVAAFAGDVRDHDGIAQAVQAAAETLGPVDAVIAGAAGNFNAPAEKISANGFKTVIDIDLLGAFNTAHAAFGQLQETAGTITFISAGQAYATTTNQVHCASAKAGIEQMMKNLALEWGPYGIRANTIVPGPIAGTLGVDKLSAEVGADEWRRAVPLGRFGTTQDIGVMAAILASPLGGYVSGTQIQVDGGFGLAGFGMLHRAWMDLAPAPVSGS